MTASEYRTRGLLAALCLLAAAILVLTALSADPAKAAVPGTTITVNTTVDESNTRGDCSLREAIKAANTNAAVDGCTAGSAIKRDAIRFSLGEQATIVLVKKLPTITDASRLTINGGRNAQITVSGDGKVRVFSERGKDAKLALANLTIADGFADTFDNSNSGIPGGGIVNKGGTLKVTHSTFSRNNAVIGGGAIANIDDGTLRVIDSTFYGNRSTVGGAIQNGARLEVSYSTFSRNDAEWGGGGIINANNKAATMSLSTSVFADNINGNIVNVCTGLPPAEQCLGTITDGGYNISDDLSFRFTKRTSKSNTDPKLDPDGLQSNGGPTNTIALLEGSPTIDHIPSATSGCGTIVKTDQRGVMRPQGEGCDVGAFEKEQQ